MTVPRLADVRCERIQFLPGDRVLVQVYRQLDRDALAKLKRTVQQWAGPDVEILVVDRTLMEVSIERR